MADPESTGENGPVVTILTKENRPAPVAVHGAWGGISASGQAVIHFYVEYPRVPSEWRVDVGRGVMETEEDSTVVREIVTTVMVSSEVADGISGVFSRSAEVLREAIAATSAEGTEE